MRNHISSIVAHCHGPPGGRVPPPRPFNLESIKCNGAEFNLATKAKRKLLVRVRNFTFARWPVLEPLALRLGVTKRIKFHFTTQISEFTSRAISGVLTGKLI